MGAALTYARRYALFTLVGIAGEDDLDAPDLNVKFKPVSKVDATRNIGQNLVQPIQSSEAAGQRPTANSTLAEGRRLCARQFLRPAAAPNGRWAGVTIHWRHGRPALLLVQGKSPTLLFKLRSCRKQARSSRSVVVGSRRQSASAMWVPRL
jgi:hypothetical protein